MLPNQKPSRFFVSCLLGSLSVISPFAIDMYLPGYLKLATEFNVAPHVISLTLSSYFIGLGAGQLIYGPLLDRYGRKAPLSIGLLIFIAASVGCALSPTIGSLIFFRFCQALGGCGSRVAAVAIVRDFYPVKDNAKILSIMFLFVAVSPLLAPSIGGLAMTWFSWRAVFIILMVIVALILLTTHWLLPETHLPDTSISLRMRPILSEYKAIFGNRRFATYALAGAFSFAGLFTYVAGSPIIFMQGFHLGAKAYSAIFAFLAVGFIGASQVNILLLKKFDSQVLFFNLSVAQVVINLVFLVGVTFNWYGLWSTLCLFFLSLSCVGVTYPNAAALAMAPFSKNAGSASALLGFTQMGVGAIISSGISIFETQNSLPIIIILAFTAIIGLGIVCIGRDAKEVAAPE